MLYAFNDVYGRLGYTKNIKRNLTPRQFGEALNERRNSNGRSNNKRKGNR